MFLEVFSVGTAKRQYTDLEINADLMFRICLGQVGKTEQGIPQRCDTFTGCILIPRKITCFEHDAIETLAQRG